MLSREGDVRQREHAINMLDQHFLLSKTDGLSHL